MISVIRVRHIIIWDDFIAVVVLTRNLMFVDWKCHMI